MTLRLAFAGRTGQFRTSCVLLVLTHRFTHLVHWCFWGGEGLCLRGHSRTKQDPTGASWADTAPVSFAVAPLRSSWIPVLSHFSRVCSVQPHRRQPTRLPRPWDSPGKNTGVGYHFLLQCMKVKSESEVAQSCPTLSDPMDCSLTGSSVHGIFQERVLEWGAIAFSKLDTST